MRIALTGASGFIGSFAVRALRRAGHDVTGLVRDRKRAAHIADEMDRIVVGSHDDTEVWKDLLQDAECVVHNSFAWEPLKSGDIEAHLRSNLVGSIRLIEAAAPRPFIYMSSIAVHHAISERWSGIIDAEHPLRPGSMYGACKAAVESHLWAAHAGNKLGFACIRPCAVYGIDPRLARSIAFPYIQSIQRGEPFNRPGGGKFVHVEDVAQAVVACIDRLSPAAPGGRNQGTDVVSPIILNLADSYARWSDWAQIIAEEAGVVGKVEIESSSPASSKNQFSKNEAHSLGIRLDRGFDGIRAYIRELMAFVND